MCVCEMVEVVVLFLLSVLRQTEVTKVAQNATFLIMPKPNNIKSVIFREHLSHIL